MAHRLSSEALFSVKDTVVVITGGGSGLGATIAHALDVNGARAVYILGRRKEVLEATAKEALNHSVHPIVTDVTSKESLEAAVETIRSREGYIDVLFANSGTIGPNIAKLFSDGRTPSIDELRGTLWDIPMDEFTSPLQLNVTAAFYTAVAFLDLLNKGNERSQARSRPRSQVIVTTSIAAFARSPAAGFAYSASKAAATQMVKQLATCLGPYKIRCNAIAPGFFPSEMTQDFPWMKTGRDPTEEGGLSSKACPLERSGNDEDMAGQAIFLVSRAGAYVNGCVQLLDGGRISIMPATY